MTSSPISAVSPMTTPMPWSMKNRRPMRAPGWISMPVRNRASCESEPRREPQRRVLPQPVRHAVRPDRVQPGVGEEVLKDASSRRVVGPGGVEVFLQSAKKLTKTFYGIGERSRLSPDVVVEHGGDVALAEVADDRDDRACRRSPGAWRAERAPRRSRRRRCRPGCLPRCASPRATAIASSSVTSTTSS